METLIIESVSNQNNKHNNKNKNNKSLEENNKILQNMNIHCTEIEKQFLNLINFYENEILNLKKENEQLKTILNQTTNQLLQHVENLENQIVKQKEIILNQIIIQNVNNNQMSTNQKVDNKNVNNKSVNNNKEEEEEEEQVEVVEQYNSLIPNHQLHKTLRTQQQEEKTNELKKQQSFIHHNNNLNNNLNNKYSIPNLKALELNHEIQRRKSFSFQTPRSYRQKIITAKLFEPTTMSLVDNNQSTSTTVNNNIEINNNPNNIKEISEMDIKQCELELQQWIENITKIKFQNNLTFYQNLKSGVILCQLINILFKNYNDIIIQNISIHSKNIWEESSNIDSFIRSCKLLFMKESLLFTYQDLKEEKNIKTIIGCLLYLKQMAMLMSENLLL